MKSQLERRKVYRMKPPPDQWRVLVAPYELVLHEGNRTAIIGRFSHSLIPKITFLHHPTDELLIRIGAFCECALASIIVGGDHRNDSLFNVTMGGPHIAVFKRAIPKEHRDLAQVKKAEPVLIGNNVVISTDATILSGADIADGCVIGAASLMTSKTDPCGVYAGIPARRLKDRFDSARTNDYKLARFWDAMAHDIPLVPGLLEQLANEEITMDDYFSTISFLPAVPQIHFDVTFTKQLATWGPPRAYSVGDKPVTDEAVIRELHSYFTQKPKNGEINWTPDIFDSLGLYS